MVRNSYMDTLEREYRYDFPHSFQEENLGKALEKAIRDTQIKIDHAFSKKAKIKAKLKPA